MLLNLARYGADSPWKAALIVTASSLAALLPILAPAGILGLALLVLIAARRGEIAAVRVLGIATVLVTVLLGVALGNWLLGLVMLLAQWLPAVLIGAVLRYTRALNLGLLSAIGFGLIAAIGLAVAAQGQPQIWSALLEGLVRPALEQQGTLDTEQIAQVLEHVAASLPAMLGGGYAMVLSASTLLGRAWHAGLYNPGGFRAEFHALNFGPIWAAIAGLIALYVLYAGQEAGIARQIMAPMVVAFALQALAVAHAGLARRGAQTGWYVALYAVVFVTLPGSLGGLAVLGILDAFLNLRARYGAAGGQ